jgi:hypothetical protein
MNITLHGPATVEMRRRDVEWIERPVQGTKIMVEEGIVWLTQSGDRRDYILASGDKFAATKRGKLLIQAMRDAVVRIS